MMRNSKTVTTVTSLNFISNSDLKVVTKAVLFKEHQVQNIAKSLRIFSVPF